MKEGYRFVYIEKDGSVREVTALERLYLQTEYSGGDGARPYVMTSFPALGSGSSGFCFRQFVPEGVKIREAAQSDRAAVAAELGRMRGQGYRVDLTGIDLGPDRGPK